MNPIQDLRENYKKGSLDSSGILKNPLDQFKLWFKEVLDKGIKEPNAMTLSTVDNNNRPSSRIVLLKDISNSAFTFFTNYKSAKSQNIENNSHVALNFFWKELERQVCISGIAKQTSREQSKEYFNSRPKGSQIGAWVSSQSEVIPDRSTLEKRQKELESKYKNVNDIPIPDHWGGFEVTPIEIEFWQGRQNRLHDRIRYQKTKEATWIIERLAP